MVCSCAVVSLAAVRPHHGQKSNKRGPEKFDPHTSRFSPVIHPLLGLWIDFYGRS